MLAMIVTPGTVGIAGAGASRCVCLYIADHWHKMQLNVGCIQAFASAHERHRLDGWSTEQAFSDSNA